LDEAGGFVWYAGIRLSCSNGGAELLEEALLNYKFFVKEFLIVNESIRF